MTLGQGDAPSLSGLRAQLQNPRQGEVKGQPSAQRCKEPGAGEVHLCSQAFLQPALCSMTLQLLQHEKGPFPLTLAGCHGARLRQETMSPASLFFTHHPPQTGAESPSQEEVLKMK